MRLHIVHVHLKNGIIYPTIHTSVQVLSQNGIVRECRNSAPDMLKVIHVSSHSDRLRLYIMYLRQISLKKIDVYIRRTWVIQCIWPLKLAYTFIYARLLESSSFRTQISWVH